jgi:glycine cleavage system H protein
VAVKTPVDDLISYKRSRFQTRLPGNRLYTASHFWLAQQEPELWRVGFTRFATRMLGEIVEHGFESKQADAVKVGQVIGWVEGFKAISDVYCVGDGTFAGGNPALDADATLIDKKPYLEGWLYQFRGAPDPNSMPVDRYIQLLDATIDKMVGTAEKS